MSCTIKTANKVCGIKQTKKALKAGIVTKLYVASDAEPSITGPYINYCQSAGIEIAWAPSMQALGNLCDLDVGCAVAAILK